MRKKLMALMLGTAIVGAGTYAAVSTKKKVNNKVMREAARWHVVTINLPIEDVRTAEDQFPEPLSKLQDIAEIRIEEAPDAKGTEIRARLADTDEKDLRHLKRSLRRLRRALRQTQMLLETGEILSPDKRPSSKPTPLNRPLRYMTRYGLGEGRL